MKALRITDVISPKIIPYEVFARAINDSASYKTDTGRILSPLEIALVKIADLNVRVAQLEQQIAVQNNPEDISE